MTKEELEKAREQMQGLPLELQMRVAELVWNSDVQLHQRNVRNLFTAVEALTAIAKSPDTASAYTMRDIATTAARRIKENS